MRYLLYRFVIFTAVLTALVCARASALNLLSEDYKAETYATYSQENVGTANYMTFDPNGNLYISHDGSSDNTADGLIYRISATGESDIFATGLCAPGEIIYVSDSNYPDGLYVTDRRGRERIYRLASDGSVTEFSDRVREHPTSLGLDATGNYGHYMYTGGDGADHIDRIFPSGQIERFSDFPYNMRGGPQSIIFDVTGNFGGTMLVAALTKEEYPDDYQYSGIFTMDTNGNATRLAPGLAGGKKLALDTQGYLGGKLYAIALADLSVANKSLWSIAPDGSSTKLAEFNTTMRGALSIGPDGAMYVAEYDEATSTVTVSRITLGPRDIYVDAVNGSDENSGLAEEAPLATIAAAVQIAKDGDTILLQPGTYVEEVNFNGKAITIQSVDEPAVIENPDATAVAFENGEGPDSVLKNVIIRNSAFGMLCGGASPTISNVTAVNNQCGAVAYLDGDPEITSSIFWNNATTDLNGCEAQYSLIESQNQFPAGMVAYWPFDEGTGTDVYDAVGNNHGTMYNASWDDGVVGSSLSFVSDAGDYVEIPDSDSLTPSQAITIGYWVYNVGGHRAGLFKYAACPSQSDGRSYRIQVNDSGEFVVSFFEDTDTLGVIRSNSIIPANEWHFVATTFDQGEAAVYIDGELDNTETMSISSIMNDNQPLTIAAEHNYCDHQLKTGFEGLLDEVVIFNRALSEGEIANLYALTSQGLPYDHTSDPMFADAAGGDYHLKSQRGRYWPDHDVWVLDDVTSPAIDAGAPAADNSNEPQPNGGQVNMGAYGNTSQASMSEWALAGDLNRDGIVNFTDYAAFTQEWLETEE